ncbi:MAG: hypothetical protein ABIQ44_12240, partial [Chloroflexia bacterium]
MSQNNVLDRFDETVESNLQRLFAVTGRRCYLIGSLHGGFPDLGHHLPGEMGGIWIAPVKVADGFWFGLSGRDGAEISWMYGDVCKSFTMRPGRAERTFLMDVDGANIEAVQEIFVPDDESGVLIEVKLHNRSEQEAKFTLNWLVRWDVQGAWWSQWPDRSDAVEQVGRGAVGRDTLHNEWCGAAFGEGMPVGFASGADLWGPEQTGSLIGAIGLTRGGILPNPDELQGAGISSQLDYEVDLQAGESKTLKFSIAGGTGGKDFAAQKAQQMLADFDKLLDEKLKRQEVLVEGMSTIETPAAEIDRAYAWQNFCLDMMTFDLPGVGLGATAGLPSFVWFFGCDTYYSVSG